MQTPLVFKLSAAAVLGLALSPQLSAQQGSSQWPEAPEPRPRGFVSRAAPSMALVQRAERPKLGVRVEDTADGVVVLEVMEDSLAAQMGLQAGDLLLNLDGRALDQVGQIGVALSEVQPGAEFTLSLVREGKGLERLQGTRPAPEPPAKPKTADGQKGGFLGVQLAETEETDAAGVTLDGVVDGSAAWFAGLAKGDVLTHLGETELGSAEELVGAVASREPGETVSLRWTRDGQEMQTNIRLGQRAATPQIMSWSSSGQGGAANSFRLPFNNSQGSSFRTIFPQSQGGKLTRRPFALKQGGQGQGLRFFGADDGNEMFFNFGDEDVIFDIDALDNLDEELEQLLEELEIEADGTHGLHGLHFDVDDALGNFGLDLSELSEGAQNLRITIQDGKMTVDSDGEVKVFELDGEHEAEHEHADEHEHAEEDADEQEEEADEVASWIDAARFSGPTRLASFPQTSRLISTSRLPQTSRLNSTSRFPQNLRFKVRANTTQPFAPQNNATRIYLFESHCTPNRAQAVLPKVVAPAPITTLPTKMDML